MADLCKSVKQVYPELKNKGQIPNAAIKKFLVKYNEAVIVGVVVVQFVILASIAQGDGSIGVIFRALSACCSLVTTLQGILNFVFLPHLYTNSKYYGLAYIAVDILSGPVALGIDVMSLFSGVKIYTLYPADALRILKLFTYEKLRVITRDIFYVMPRAMRVFLAMIFMFFIFSYIGLQVFHDIHPDQFRNIFVSLLSIFQVMTFDCWNLQVNIPIIRQWGSVWSFYFVTGIFLLQFFYFNYFLSQFVTYYSNRGYRVNFVYKQIDDEVCNKKLSQEIKQEHDLQETLNVCGLASNPKDQSLWGIIMGSYKYIYLLSVFVVEWISINYSVPEAKMVIQIIGGILMLCELVSTSLSGNEEKEQSLSYLPILLISGCGGFLADAVYITQGDYSLWAGNSLRILILLATSECQQSFSKLQEVVTKIGEMGIVNLMLLYVTSLIGYYGLYRFSTIYGFYFEDVTNSFLFLLQTITFDAWGDIARAAMLTNPIFAGYFAFLVLFMGFLMQNLLVGTIATIVQPAVETQFEKSRVLAKKVPGYLFYLLKETFRFKKTTKQNNQSLPDLPKQQISGSLNKLDSLLKEFSAQSQNNNEALTIEINGKSYVLSAKARDAIFVDQTK